MTDPNLSPVKRVLRRLGLTHLSIEWIFLGALIVAAMDVVA